MTFVLGPQSWAIQGFQLGLNEIASGLAVGKACGSLFTRRENSNLFDAVQQEFKLSIGALPKWLRMVEFTRSCTMHGDRMRRIGLKNVMQDVDESRLSGIVTFVVLCTHFVEDKMSIFRMLKLLMLGELGTVVQVDPDRKPHQPYNFQPLVLTFIQACIDSDLDSDKSRKTKTWMAQLASFGNLGWRGDDVSIRREKASVHLLAEILGGPSMEEEMAKSKGTAPPPSALSGGWARVHNTLHLSSAYIALASAGNGANIVVECVTNSGSQFFPEQPEPAHREYTFLVRFWLTQPPEQVHGIFRYSSHTSTPIWKGDEDEYPSELVDDENITIFGGTLEIAEWTAKFLQLDFKYLDKDRPDALGDIWIKAADLAKKWHWVVRKPPSKLYPLRFNLESPEPSPTLSKEVVPLSKAVSRNKNLKGISRNVAALVHDVYGLNDYTLQHEELNPEVLAAMEFVLVAIAVHSLRSTMYSHDSSLDQYAMNLATLEYGKGALRRLVPAALSKDGIAAKDLIWSASTLWGGASLQSQGSSHVVDSVMGVVAPNCTVILDFLRDPLNLVEHGVESKMLSLWRGAVPMLPRDPHSGFVKAQSTRITDNPTQLEKHFTATRSRSGGDQLGNLFVTFEPYIKDPSFGVFCCWNSGKLAGEFTPLWVFTNLLSRPAATLPEWDQAMPVSRQDPKGYRRISKGELLSVKEFVVAQDHIIIVDGLHKPEWVFFAAGCCPKDSTIVHRGNFDDSLFEELRSRLTIGDVILVNPL